MEQKALGHYAYNEDTRFSNHPSTEMLLNAIEKEGVANGEDTKL